MFDLSKVVKTVQKKRKRVGKGEGSNRGKNCGKGHKGQVKRGGKLPVTFEGGGKSLVRRTPKKRGFKGPTKRQHTEITTKTIDENYKASETVSLKTLLEKALISDKVKKVRIIKNGELSKKIKFNEEEVYLTKGVKELIKE